VAVVNESVEQEGPDIVVVGAIERERIPALGRFERFSDNPNVPSRGTDIVAVNHDVIIHAIQRFQDFEIPVARIGNTDGS